MNPQTAKQKPAWVKRWSRHIGKPLNEVLTARHPKQYAPTTLGRMRKNRQEAEADRLSEPVNEGTKKPRRLLGFSEFCEVFDRFQAAKKAEAEAESQGQSSP
jgi:hypothetical protein